MELPSVPRRQVVTDQIQNRVGPGDAGASSRAFAGMLGDLGQAAADYTKAIATTTVSRQLDDAQTQALKLSVEANGSADGFAKSWQTYQRELLKKTPLPYRKEVEDKLIGIGGQTFRKVFADAADRTGKIALDAIDSRIETLTADMTELARQGQTGGKPYQDQQVELDDLLKQKSTNSLIAYSPEHEAADREKFHDQFLAAGVSGELEKIYNDTGPKGGFAAAQKRAQEIYNDAGDGLDKIQKLKAIQAGLKSINALYAADTQARRQFGADRVSAVAALKDGSLAWDDPLVEDMKSTADQLRDPMSRLSLESAQAVARLNPMRSLDLNGQMNFMREMTGGGATGAADILRQEEGFRTSAYYDVNAYRTGYGSDTITTADGRIVRVTAASTVTQADAERDLSRRIGEFASAAAVDVGQDAWNNLPANARSGLVSVAYNYGSLPSSVVAAVKTGDVAKVADAVRSLSANPARRAREAAIIGGDAIQPSSLAGYTKGVIPEVRIQIKGSLTSALTAANETLQHDQPLDDGQMQDMVDAARIVDDADTYAKVGEVFAKSAAVSAMVGVPIPDQAGLIDQLRAPGPVGDEALRQSMLDQATQTHDRMAKLLENDPRALGIQLGLFKAGPTIDFANIGDAPGILAARVPEMERLAVAEQSGPLSVLRPDEAKAMTAAWNAADVNAKLGILATLSGSLPPKTLMATLGQFAEKPDTQMLAIAGALSATNPEAGAAVIRGQAALAANSKFGYGEDNDADKAARDAYFPTTVLAPNMVAAWQSHMDAAKAIYADASARAGDASGKFNEDRWKAAIDSVTGGMVEFNGAKIVTPRHGIDQNRFDEVMAGLPEGVFAGAATPDGTPITKDFVRRLGRLQSYADGRYVIGLGDTGAYAVAGVRSPSEAGITGPFVLDLRPFLDPGAMSPTAGSPVSDAARQLSGNRGKLF